jgi:hypothetical protein
MREYYGPGDLFGPTICTLNKQRKKELRDLKLKLKRAENSIRNIQDELDRSIAEAVKAERERIERLICSSQDGRDAWDYYESKILNPPSESSGV